MNKIRPGFCVAILFLNLIACNNKKDTSPETQETKSSLNQNLETMKSYLSIFEIPATDISRAITFYQDILEIQIEKVSMPGMEMGVLPYEDQMVTGIIVKGEDYQPSAKGVTIYLDGGDNLQTILDKVENQNGKVLVPKSPLADESGYFALFLDSEGNKIGLHSPN